MFLSMHQWIGSPPWCLWILFSAEDNTTSLCKFQGIPTPSVFVLWQYRVWKYFSLFCAHVLTKGIVNFSLQLWSVHFSLTIKFQKRHIGPEHNCNSLETSILKKSIRIAYEAWLVFFGTYFFIKTSLLLITDLWFIRIYLCLELAFYLCALILTIWNGTFTKKSS